MLYLCPGCLPSACSRCRPVGAEHPCKCQRPVELRSRAPPKPSGSLWGGCKSWGCLSKPLGLGFCESWLSRRIPTPGLMGWKYCKSSPFSVLFWFFSPDVCVFPLPSLAKASGAKAQDPGTPRGRGKQSTLNPQENGDRKQTRRLGGRRKVCLLAAAKGRVSSGRSMDSKRVLWFQFGILSSGPALLLVRHGRDKEGLHSGCTQGSTPSCFQLAGWVSLAPL